MMWMHVDEFRHKVRGCWLGKNIGGTLGAPFEGRRGVIEIDYYTQDLSGEPAPNDDLDLQLVWLNAVEKYGRQVNAAILGEYWHDWVVPNWSEYGVGMANLRLGLAPPLSGYVNNPHRDSCGAFIRSEVWACLAPGHPELAARYAYEDAIVDHSHEGVYGEVFCASLQSAAFVESDPLQLIKIGLSWIPTGCAVATGVRSVIESQQAGLDWKAARKRLLQTVPDAFFWTTMGEPEPDLPRGPTGFDAPANVAIFVLGWLYGQGDFGRSLCIAVGCGEDTDCTAATLGATLGILDGAEAIPARWVEPIGDKIVTISLNRADLGGRNFPATVSELTEKIVRLAPRFLDMGDVVLEGERPGYALQLHTGAALFSQPRFLAPGQERTFEQDVLQRQPFSVRYETPLFTAWLEYGAEPLVQAGQALDFQLHFENCTRRPLWLEMRWHNLPQGWGVSPSPQANLMLPHHIGGLTGMALAAFTLSVGEVTQARYELFVEIVPQGRHTRLALPVTLLAAHHANSQ